MIARVLSIATKISSEIFKCNRQVAGATNLSHDQACRVHRGKATGAQAPDWVRINSTCATKLLQGGGEGGTKIRGSFYGADASGGHRGVFVFGGALAAADDRAGVAHAAAWRRGCPSMKPTTGFFTLALMHSAALSSALPPISPIKMTACVSASSLKNWMASRNVVPMIGSPPMPMHVDWPMPSCVN